MVASFFESIRRSDGRRLWVYELRGAIGSAGFVPSKAIRRFAQINADGGLASALVGGSGVFAGGGFAL